MDEQTTIAIIDGSTTVLKTEIMKELDRFEASILRARVAIDEVAINEKIMREEQLTISGEVAEEKDVDTGKAIYTNETKRDAETFKRLTKNVKYSDAERAKLNSMAEMHKFSDQKEIASMNLKAYIAMLQR